MEHVIQLGLSNAAAATVLAILAAIATRIWRNPHFAYALWLVVLLRLVAPPLVPVQVPLPAWAIVHPTVSTPIVAGPMASSARSSTNNQPSPAGGAEARTSTAAFEPGQFGEVGKLPATQPIESLAVRRLSLVPLIAAVWLGGTIFYVLLVGLRARRFSRALDGVRREVCESLHSEAAAVAATIGLRRLPHLALIEAPLPPMVWPGWRPTVLLPRGLVDSLSAPLSAPLSPPQRRLLLLHELLHIRRRDHLVRWFQIGVVAIHWWNPIAWWAARRLERASEECCDAAVLYVHPDQSEGYGQTLFAVSEFLSTGTFPAPALSIGILRKTHLKRRLTMILNGPRWPRLSKRRLACFGILGAALVGVTWTAATAQNASAPTVNPVPSPAARPVETPAAKPVTQPVPLASNVPKDDSQRERADRQTVAELDTLIKNQKRMAALLNSEPLKPAPGDDELQKLLKERYNNALRAVKLSQYAYEAGTSRMSPLCAASRNLVEAELSLVDKPRDEIRVVERYVEFAYKTWKGTEDKLKAGGVTGFSPIDEAEARAARFEAEIKLLRLRAELKQKEPERVPVAAEPQPAARPLAPGQLPALLIAKPLEPAPGDDDRRALLKERYNAALRLLRVSHSRREAGGGGSAMDVVAAARQLLAAEVALDKSQDIVRVYERYLEFMRFFEKEVEAQFQARITARDEFEAAHEARLDTEIKLLDAKSARWPVKEP